MAVAVVRSVNPGLSLMWWCLAGIAKTWECCKHVSKRTSMKGYVRHAMGRGRISRESYRHETTKIFKRARFAK